MDDLRRLEHIRNGLKSTHGIHDLSRVYKAVFFSLCLSIPSFPLYHHEDRSNKKLLVTIPYYISKKTRNTRETVAMPEFHRGTAEYHLVVDKPAAPLFEALCRLLNESSSGSVLSLEEIRRSPEPSSQGGIFSRCCPCAPHPVFPGVSIELGPWQMTPPFPHIAGTSGSDLSEPARSGVDPVGCRGWGDDTKGVQSGPKALVPVDRTPRLLDVAAPRRPRPRPSPTKPFPPPYPDPPKGRRVDYARKG